MASISNPSSSSLFNLSASFPICVSSSSMFPTYQKPSQRSKPKRHHASKVACNGNPNKNPTNRRDILIGLGGLYGATTLTSNNSNSAIAAPLSLPDPTNCVPATVPDGADSHCCPPSPVIDYVLPQFNNTPLRIRQPAHLVSDEYLAKYKEAVKLMKALPGKGAYDQFIDLVKLYQRAGSKVKSEDEDPHSFTQQANVHCAYCAGGYRQNGFPDRDFDVHHSWIFLPFHRWYLYFYERILGSLIGDPTFALPFWNWDNPPGMEFPSIYKDQYSPLYDPLRDARHLQQGTIVDLNYNRSQDNSNWDPQKQINANLSTMKRQIVFNGKFTSQFHGIPFRAGCLPNPGDGSLEIIHNHVHAWVGDRKQPHHEDMGVLYAAARDPVFFAHHSNVDRMWNIWKKLPLPGPGPIKIRIGKDYDDEDWKESSFLFYDENKNLVRVKVKDCLDSTKMGYDYYKDVDLPWLRTELRPKYFPRGNDKIQPVSGKTLTLKTLRFPLTLKSIERTTVKRPELETRSNGEKEEVLVIDLDFDKCEDVKFDVFINDNGDDQIGPNDSEFAGTFLNLPHSSSSQSKRTITSFRLGITDLLKELQVKDDEDSIAVTLVPRYGEKPVIVKGMHIKLVRGNDEDM